MKRTVILGIETSCDETAAAVVVNGREIASNIVYSQIKFHKPFFGVVPEIASRKHAEVINGVIDEAMKEAGMDFDELSAVAVTNGPGLIPALLVGVLAAKTISFVKGIPLVPVNHIFAHAYAPVMDNPSIPFPHISLIISGGHTLLLKANSVIEFEFLGSTVDDAVGEAYDKVAKMLGLEYPGGPIIDKMAKEGNPDRFNFPQTANKPYDRCNFSFSGLKTAVLYTLRKLPAPLDNQTIKDVSAGFQKAVIDTLYSKVKNAVEDTGIKTVVVSGGVSANSGIRKRFLESNDFKTYFAPLKLCTDNAAMVAGLGFHLLENGVKADLSLDVFPRLSWVKKGRRNVK